MFAESPFATEPFAGNYAVFTNGKVVQFDKTIVLGIEKDLGIPLQLVFNTNIAQAPTFFLKGLGLNTASTIQTSNSSGSSGGGSNSNVTRSLLFTLMPTYGVQSVPLSQITVTVLNSANQADTTYNGTIKLTMNTGVFSNGKNFVTATVVNGVAVFNGLTIADTGTYALVASSSGIPSVVSLPITIGSPTEIVIAIDWE